MEKNLTISLLEQSRRDDLESLGYVLIYFITGSLPWQGLKAQTKKQKYDRITEKKLSTPVETLCKDLPGISFLFFLKYEGAWWQFIDNYHLLFIIIQWNIYIF